MEPEYWDKNPFKATAKAFPPGFHYRPTTLNKTRKFYEFILVDTNSVSIKHFKDPKDPNLNTHSTIQILKVMQPRHYGSNLNQPKKFSAPFDPTRYTYWDYIDAWTNVFWHQNNKYKHSWLIYFKNNTTYNFPNWFLQWWNFSDQSHKFTQKKSNKDLPNLKKCIIIKNQEFWLIWCTSPALLCHESFHGNIGMRKKRITNNFHLYKDMLLLNGGHSSTLQRQLQTKSRTSSKATQNS